MSDSRALFTFLFTDIEGSSRLWEENSEAMAMALARHDTLLNDVFSGHGGHVFKTMGDSVCVAFSRDSAAVSAIVDAQRTLLTEEWETARPIRVRAAIHKGFAELRNSDYFGPTLNRTARILAAGHGGQTLLSRAAKEDLILPNGVSLRDLGERRLRDLTSPEHIFQLVVPGLREEFPPLRSIEVLPNNLPAQVTGFIGREKDLAHVKRLLEESRLVTLTGPGGTGKTRLSLQVAADVLERFMDGVWLVELAMVSDPDAVVISVASALGLREDAGRTLEETLFEYLRTKNILLLLDNCEHLVAACAGLTGRLLRIAPQLRVLAASREALAIAGETAYPLLSLSVPESMRDLPASRFPAEDASKFESVRLFVERAAAVQPGFRITDDNALMITKICWRLDGMPLAIELAAARVKMLTPEQIYQRLDDRFRLLTSGGRTVMPRQQTLTALIDWSYDLLSPQERLLLLRLSVFGRGRTLKAIEAVCSGDGIEEWEILDLLQQLIAKSLVSVEQNDRTGSRYFILESVWDYARTKLDASGEAKKVCGRHLDYFLKMAEKAEEKLAGADQLEWLEKLTPEHVNFRLALEWSAENPEAVRRGLCLAGALVRYWEIRSHMQEGYEHLMRLLALPEAQARDSARVKALAGAGRLVWLQDNEEIARGLYTQAIDLARELGDEKQVAYHRALLGFVEWSDGNVEAARAHFTSVREYAEAKKDQLAMALGLSGLGSVARSDGDLGTARLLKIESIAIYREIGDRWIVSLLCFSLGKVLVIDRDYIGARHALSEAVTIAEQLGNEWLVPLVLEAFGDAALGEDQHEVATKVYATASVLRERLGLPPPPTERAAYDRALDKMRKGLGKKFTETWEEGKRLAADQAVKLAVGGGN